MVKKILFKGNFSEDDTAIICRKKSSRKIDFDIEQKAKEIWEKRLVEAKKQGKKIWDQPVYRLEKYRVLGSSCFLEFSTIPFSIRSSIKEFTNKLYRRGVNYLPMAAYSSIFVETTDGLFVFGEKSDRYVANRKLSYIGGVFNKLSDSSGSLFESAVNEVKEELGVSKGNIKMIKLLGALRTESGNVAFVLYCRLNLDKKGLLEKFEKRADLEISKLFFGERNNLQDIGVNGIGKDPEIVSIFRQMH